MTIELIPPGPEELDRTGFALLDNFRKMVRKEIHAQLKRDGYHKRYEGAVSYSVTLPPVVDWSDMPDPLGRAADPKPVHELHLYCYVLGPSRNYEWKGDSAEDVFRRATKEFLAWVAEAKLEHEGALP